MIKIGITQSEEPAVQEFCLPVYYNNPDAEANLQKALADLQAGDLNALTVTSSVESPLAAIEAIIPDVKEHVLPMYVCDTFRVAWAENEAELAEKARELHAVLLHDFLVTCPRVAVLASSTETMKPVNDTGLLCFGPYSIEQLLENDYYKTFDAILAVKQEQARLFSETGAEDCVMLAGNLPFIITGTNPAAIAETSEDENAASVPRNLLHAIFLAADIHNNRAFDKEIRRNPLKKLYIERGNDNVKLDLTKED